MVQHSLCPRFARGQGSRLGASRVCHCRQLGTFWKYQNPRQSPRAADVLVGAPGRQVATQRPSPPAGSCLALAPLTPALMAATSTFRIREEREAAFPMWIRGPSTSQHEGVFPVWSHCPVPRGDRSSSRCPHRCFAISGPGFTPAPGGLKSKRRQGLRFFRMSLAGVLVHLLKQGSARSRPAVCPFIRGRARLGPLLRERQRGQRSSHFSRFSRHVASHTWSISDGARIGR